MDDLYFIIDIEVCPIYLEKYEELSEEQRIKLLNPIDSKIIALGIRYNGQNRVFLGEDEKKLLEDFWNEWKSIKKNDSIKVVGFNINNFDLPFITTRSLICNVIISPFLIKSTIDLREKINAYRYGKSRGKLKDFASLIGLPTKTIEGKDIAKLYIEKKYDLIKEYLINDLEIIDNIFKRAKNTRVLEINKW